MPPKQRPVTVKTLQALLTRIGSASSGTKASLQARFLRDLQVSRGFGGREREKEGKGGLRIVSVDMGIKNLAFCVARVEFVEKQGGGGDQGKGNGKWDAVMHVERWEKIDLLGVGKSLSPSGMQHEEQDAHTPPLDGLAEETEDHFSPSSLSHTAYSLITSTLLPARPDIILIEKQRWRSGGGTAILQWTVRVNTLEAMLWAVLTSVREERRRRTRHPVEKKETETELETEKEMEKGFEIWAVDPKRVGQFWLSGQPNPFTPDEPPEEPEPEVETQDEENEEDGNEKEKEKEKDEKQDPPKKKPSRTKAEKRAKISLLQNWLTSSPPSSYSLSSSSSSATTPTLTFHIHPAATPTLTALCAPLKAKPPLGQRPPTPQPVVNDADLRKLDDVTDCFLQAAAWVAWEANRRGMAGVWERERERERERDGGREGEGELSPEVGWRMLEE